jgi:HUS1 checkpoint protein
MRFKAKLLNDQLSLLHAIIAPISKLQDAHRHYAVLYLDEEYVRISFKNSESGITCFVELSQRDLFVEHRIESAADNVIVCQVDLVSFKLALQSVVGGGSGGSSSSSTSKQRDNGGDGDGDGNSRSNNNNSSNSSQVLRTLQQQHEQVTLKLAKRNGLPCLCLEANHDVEIHQAIPVTILRRAEMQNHLPPQINMPQVQLELPMNRPIRPLVDKLKGIGEHVFLEGNMKGDLTIRLDHDGASMACFYNHLIPRWPEDEVLDESNNHHENSDGGLATRNNNTMPDSNASCTVKVDVYKLSACLQWQHHSPQQQQWQLPVTSCLLGMVSNEMLVLHVLLKPDTVGFFTYYLPVHFLRDDDDNML